MGEGNQKQAVVEKLQVFHASIGLNVSSTPMSGCSRCLFLSSVGIRGMDRYHWGMGSLAKSCK